MDYIVRENNKSLFTGYDVKDENNNLEINIIGKKDIDNILELYNKNNDLLRTIRFINCFGITNYEIYEKDSLILSIGEEINLFKNTYYYDLLGWKLKHFKDGYIITNIEDEEIAEIIFEEDFYKIINAEKENLLNIVVITLVLFITKKEGIDE